MKSNLEELSEIVARANDLFYNKFNKIDTLMGIMDKNLRKQGMQADAITIDCVALDKKIVIGVSRPFPRKVQCLSIIKNKNNDLQIVFPSFGIPTKPISNSEGRAKKI